MASQPFPLTAERRDAGDFLAAVRALARRRPAQDPNTKKLWRLVFQVENLRALTRSHRALVPLVDEILSQSVGRSEEHTSELQSLRHLVCRLLLEKKKNKTNYCPYIE